MHRSFYRFKLVEMAFFKAKTAPPVLQYDPCIAGNKAAAPGTKNTINELAGIAFCINHGQVNRILVIRQRRNNRLRQNLIKPNA